MESNTQPKDLGLPWMSKTEMSRVLDSPLREAFLKYVKETFDLSPATGRPVEEKLKHFLEEVLHSDLASTLMPQEDVPAEAVAREDG